MAARKPNSKEKETGAEKRVKPSEARPSISQRKLRELMATHRSAKNDITEISDGIGAAIKDAVENYYLNRKAYRVAITLDRMEPEKLADFLDCFERYIDISGLRARAESAPRLSFDEDAQEPEEDVRPFPQPSGIAAE